MRRLKKGTPGKGEETPRDSFSHTPVSSGTKNVWTGWLAGEPYWALAHEHKPPAVLGTKPCLAWLTDGALVCPRCKPAARPAWIGWVPIYRELDHQPCIVIVHESVMDLLAGLKYATRVMVGRSAETSSVYVRRAESQYPAFVSQHEQRQGPRDITPDLLLMWGMPTLDQWIRGAAGAESASSDTAVSLAGAAGGAEPDARPVSVPGAVDADATFGALVNRIKGNAANLGAAPSANGKPKPKG